MNRTTAHTALVHQALVALSRAGVMAWENRTGAAISVDGARFIAYGLKGSTDILGIIPPNGRALVAEAKTGTGRTTEQQRRFGQAATAKGALWVVFHNLDELMLAIEHAKSSAADAILIPTRRGAAA